MTLVDGATAGGETDDGDGTAAGGDIVVSRAGLVGVDGRRGTGVGDVRGLGTDRGVGAAGGGAVAGLAIGAGTTVGIGVGAGPVAGTDTTGTPAFGALCCSCAPTGRAATSTIDAAARNMRLRLTFTRWQLSARG